MTILAIRGGSPGLTQQPLDRGFRDNALGVIAHHDVPAACVCEEYLERGLRFPAAAPHTPLVRIVEQAGLPAQRRSFLKPPGSDQLGQMVIAWVLTGVVRRVQVKQIKRLRFSDQLESVALVRVTAVARNDPFDAEVEGANRIRLP